MSEDQEVYEKKIRLLEANGATPVSDIIRFTNSRIESVAYNSNQVLTEFDKNMSLFSEQSITEFKKVWAKLKELEARVPGQVVKPAVPKPSTPPAVDPKPDVPKPDVPKPDANDDAEKPVKSARVK